MAYLIAWGVLILLAVLGIYLLSETKYTSFGKSLILMGVAAVTAFAVFIVSIAIMFSTADTAFYSTAIVILGILIVATVGFALWGALKRKSVYIPLIICVALCLLAIGGHIGYDIYIDSIPTVGESDSLLDEYEPYGENTKVAELDEPSTLTIDSYPPRMDGATALYPIYSAFAKAVYPKELLEDRIGTYGDLQWEENSEYLRCSTTTWAYENIVTGEADIIFAAEPSEEQKQFAAENGVELVYTPIGREAFVFFVNSKNPINDITLEQVQGIYSGEITKWSELGVDDFGDIQAFQRDEGSGSQSALVRIMGDKELMTPPEEQVIDGMGGIINRAADYKNFKNSIGYSFRFYSTEMVKNNKIKLLSINGVQPSLENIENGTYPIASYFYAVTRSDMSENTKLLLDWITGEQGQKLIELTGYTPVK